MSARDTLGITLAEALLTFGQHVAGECTVVAEQLRNGPAMLPEVWGRKVSLHEQGRVTQIMVQVVEELAEGDIEDLYTHMAPYVKQKVEARIVHNKERVQ